MGESARETIVLFFSRHYYSNHAIMSVVAHWQVVVQSSGLASDALAHAVALRPPPVTSDRHLT